MDDLILSFSDHTYVNEGKIGDWFLKAIDKILTSIVEFLKKIRDKIRQFRLGREEKVIQNKLSNIDVSKISGDFEYFVPNKDSIKIYLDSLYVESYNAIINKALMYANKGDTQSLYTQLFGSYPTDVYSDNNNYIYGITEYLYRVFNTECKDKEDLNNKLAVCLTNKKTSKYVSVAQFKQELSANNNDVFKTSLGRDIKQIRDIKQWILDYGTSITNQALTNISKLKDSIKKNSNNYNQEIENALLVMVNHYTRMIKDSNIEGAISSINRLENDIMSRMTKGDN